jgi:hypothetical protein
MTPAFKSSSSQVDHNQKPLGHDSDLMVLFVPCPNVRQITLIASDGPKWARVGSVGPRSDGRLAGRHGSGDAGQHEETRPPS